jgi:hypothetical protein
MMPPMVVPLRGGVGWCRLITTINKETECSRRLRLLLLFDPVTVPGDFRWGGAKRRFLTLLSASGLRTTKTVMLQQFFVDSRSARMPTECRPHFFGFEPVEGRTVVAAFECGHDHVGQERCFWARSE